MRMWSVRGRRLGVKRKESPVWAGAGGEGSWRGLTCGKAVKDYRWQHGPHGGCGLS